jgi:hypothetical protein
MKLAKLGVIAAVVSVLLIGTTIVITSGGDPGVSPDNPRFRASVVLLSLYGQKDVIERYVRENHALDGVVGRVVVDNNSFIGRVVISNTGHMVAFDVRNEFVASLEPTLVGQQIKWRCSVVPVKWEPKPCRTP